MLNLFKKKIQDESLENQKKDLERFGKDAAIEFLNGLDCDALPNSTGEFGRSFTNPIPVNGPMGEIKYLIRLRTADGRGLLFHRLGSKNGIDIFESVSEGGEVWDILYLDMYHPRRSKLAPEGYNFSKYNELFCQAMFGYYATHIDPDFPFGLAESISELFGGRRLVELYKEIIEDRSKFVRPPEHWEKLKNFNITARYE